MATRKRRKPTEPEVEIIPPEEKAVPNKGIWVPGGPSPNPKGRPRGYGEMMAYCREFTAESIDVIVEIMRDDKEDARVRLVAAETLLSRGWGKPSTIDPTKPDPIDERPQDDEDEKRLVNARTRVLEHLDRLLEQEKDA